MVAARRSTDLPMGMSCLACETFLNRSIVQSSLACTDRWYLNRYGRAEACGAALVERCESAGGACIYGSGVNQDGRSASFMAPNGIAKSPNSQPWY